MNVADTSDLSGESKMERLIETVTLDNTPFTMVCQDKNYFVTMGNYMLTDKHMTIESALNELETNKWDIILRIAIIVAEKSKSIKTSITETE